MAANGAADTSGARGARMLSLGRWITVTAGVFVLALVVGGYGMRWRWTGLAQGVTLWNWLEALLLPLALGLVPVVLLQRERLRRGLRLLLAAVAVVFAAIVIAGYAVPLAWTGFAGHTLWDWFELALLPLVVTAAPVWVRADLVRREHLLAAAAALVLFAAFAVAGYSVPLDWTGFTDNTAWDWLKLLLLPALVPTVVIPLLTTMMRTALGGGGPAEPAEQPSEGR
jgi:hypothetical protein